MLRRLSLRRFVALTLVLLLLPGCGDAADGDAEAIAAVEANEEAYIDAFFAKDLDAVMDTFADDVVFVDQTFSDYLEGKAAVETMYTGALSMTDPELSEVTDHFVAADGTFADQQSVFPLVDGHAEADKKTREEHRRWARVGEDPSQLQRAGFLVDAGF